MRPVRDWEEKDIDDLYRGQIMESLTLEYKASGALKNDDHQKKANCSRMSRRWLIRREASSSMA
jgi:hypothetical protein